MDPVTVLGIVSGSSQLIQHCILIVTFLSKLATQFRDAPEKLRQQAGQIEQVLDLFNRFHQTRSIQNDSIAALLVTCLQNATLIEKRLLELAPRNGASRAIRWTKSVQIIMADKKLDRMFVELERNKTLLIVGIQQVDSSALHDVQIDVKEVLVDMKGLNDGVATIKDVVRGTADDVSKAVDTLQGLVDSIEGLVNQSSQDPPPAQDKTNYIVPNRRIDSSIGREDVLHQINAAFSLGEGRRIVVICGLGGQGKTQVALEHCHRAKTVNKIRTIFWVDAMTESSVLKSFVTISESIRTAGVDFYDQKARIRYVLEQLSEWPDTWTMVFDNYDDPSSFHIQDYFASGSHGHILVTSRHADSFALTENAIELGGLPKDDALQLLGKHSDITPTRADVEHARKIVERLGFHALAIAQAGSFIYSQKIRYNQFLIKYDRQRHRRAVLNSAPRVSEYRKTLSDSAEETTLNAFTTLDLSFEQLLKQDPGNVKSRCLTLFAFFDSTDMSELLLKTYCDRKRPTPDSTDFCERLIAAVTLGDPSRLIVSGTATSTRSTWESDDFVEIVSALCQMSLVQSWSRDESGLCHLNLHPLVRDWLRLRTDLEESKNYSIAVADILSETIRSYEVTVGANAYEMPMKLRQKLLAQTTIYRENFRSLRTMLDPDEFCKLYSHYYTAEIPISSFLRDSGYLDEAEEVAQHLATWIEQEYGLEDVRSFASLQNLTHIFSNQGRYFMAESLARRVLPAKEKILGLNHLDTLRTLTSLTINLEKQGKYVEAEGLLREGLERKRRSLGPDHTSSIFSLGSLGVVLTGQSRYVDAERILREALESGQKVYGPENSFVLNFTSNLAFALAGQGQYIESEELRRPLLLLQEKNLGMYHMETLRSRVGLAHVLSRQAKFVEAEDISLAARQKATTTLGPDHPVTLECSENMGLLRYLQGRYQESLLLYGETLTGRKILLGPQHPHTLKCQECLSEVAEKLKSMPDLELPVKMQYECSDEETGWKTAVEWVV